VSACPAARGGAVRACQADRSRTGNLGARVDNLVFHAALGDLAAVRGYFAAGVPEGNQLEHALGTAALHGCRDVVEFLLGKDPNRG
jgi:hypothetical protein